MDHSRTLFLHSRLCIIVSSQYLFDKIDHVWIPTRVLWCWKWPLSQLRATNHWPWPHCLSILLSLQCTYLCVQDSPLYTECEGILTAKCKSIKTLLEECQSRNKVKNEKNASHNCQVCLDFFRRRRLFIVKLKKRLTLKSEITTSWRQQQHQIFCRLCGLRFQGQFTFLWVSLERDLNLRLSECFRVLLGTPKTTPNWLVYFYLFYLFGKIQSDKKRSAVGTLILPHMKWVFSKFNVCSFRLFFSTLHRKLALLSGLITFCH